MKWTILVCALPLLTACMSMKNVKELPLELIYQPPVSGARATIVGKMEPRHTKLVGDRIAYIMEIDGKRVHKDKKILTVILGTMCIPLQRVSIH